MAFGSESAENRSLSHASLAFDTSSRKNTSLLLYKEFTIKSINRCTCARASTAIVSLAEVPSVPSRVF
jgi:hypothetical protein